MKRAGKDFSGRITPLFDTMMVQPVKEMGEDSDHPTDSTPIPIINQPSSSSQPKKDKPSKKAQRQEAEVPQDEAEHKESVPTPSNDPQPSGEDSMQLTNLMKRIQRLERRKMSRPTSLKRLKKVGMSRRVESSEDQESLGVPEDASKQGGDEEIDAMIDVSLVDDTPRKTKMMTYNLVKQYYCGIICNAVPITNEEITLAQTLIQIKAAKPKVVTTAATTTTTTRPKDRGRKDQIALDEQIARDIQAKLDAELLEEQKLARKQKEEANIALIES
ncbi:hypothetical protein Tco_1079893 [Tanacetum coccineum]|uniref:Uncharacterized protein n=1 Tax=Tanacetum coccineum TaxID=301880 RepID=A0ABQ5HT90_9ASTR